jgi:uncharacterized protein
VSERTSYAPGTPSWTDLGSPDPDAAVDFYGALFGWQVGEAGDPEQTGGYRMAQLRGKAVAGMMPLMAEGQPPAWQTYVSVADVDATASAVSEAGGSVIAAPMDVMEAGRMAVFADPSGAVFGVWQPGLHAGSGLVNEPGAMSWNELNTRDPEVAKDFYTRVFGWGAEEQDMGEIGTYTTWKLGADEVGGMLDMRGRVPDQVPAHWLTYFGVDDADAAVAKVTELGGGVAFGPIDIAPGRFAVLHDPHGAMFAVIKLSEEALQSA